MLYDVSISVAGIPNIFYGSFSAMRKRNLKSDVDWSFVDKRLK